MRIKKIARAELEMSREPLDHFAAYDLAREMLKRAGFRLHTVAGNSESCYFDHPARPGVLLRTSMHAGKGKIGHSNVSARVTISARGQWSEYTIFCALRVEIGNYFLRDPAPSRYRGKRGTWEAESDAALTMLPPA